MKIDLFKILEFLINLISFLFGNNSALFDFPDDTPASLKPAFNLYFSLLRFTTWTFLIAVTALILIIVHMIS